tara:strand:+ start:327 stop:998 length:672 start_codon:yes stop_codon:yes gene_type:complete
MTHSYDHATATGRKLQVLNEAIKTQRILDSRYKDDIWHDKDSNLAGVQKVIDVDNITISRADIKAEEARLNAFGAQYGKAFSKSGTWSMRVNNQRHAIEARQSQQIALREIGLKAAKINPINIERWTNEDRLVEEEEERLLQIELEKQRIQAENQRIENQRLMEIENKRIQYEIIEEEKRIRRINELQEIENKKIIPAVVASSSLIPLAIIAFLLINSRKGKK